MAMVALTRKRVAAAGSLFFLLTTTLVSCLSTSRKLQRRNIPCPPGLEYFDFQKDAIHALVHRDIGLLLCDEMGLGKSISAIGALNLLEHYEKVLIIAPKSLIPMWETELEKWLNDKTRIVGAATAQGGIPPECNIILMNYDIVFRYKEEIDALGPWNALICDEAHYLKNAQAVRTIAILGDTTRQGNKGGIQAQHKWFLTGSPVLNNPIELYPLLSALDPLGRLIPQVRDYDTFCNHYCIRKETPWGVTYKGGKNLAELRTRLRSGDSPLMLRRTKNDVLQDLPEKRHQLLPLEDHVVAGQEERTIQEALAMAGTTIMVTDDTDLSSLKVKELKSHLQARGLPVTGRKDDLVDRLRQHTVASSRASLMEARDKLATEGDTKEIFDSVGSALRAETGGRKWAGLKTIFESQSSVVMGALARARHATALEKVPYAIEIIENAIESHKVVVFAHHRDVQYALAEAFEGRVAVLHGESTQKERSEVVDQFQQDESIRLFVGSIRAAGVGITLTAASHVLFVEFDWSPMIVEQAEDRCHRVGQSSSVLVQYLFFRGTIDEHLASLLASKQSTVKASLDSPTGATSWVFDFGKHKGDTVADVAASNSGYLTWLVDQGAHANRNKLCNALNELGYAVPTKTFSADSKDGDNGGMEESSRKGANLQARRPVPRPDVSASIQGNFIMPFGKHKGKKLAEIPKSYRKWLISSGASFRNRELLRALKGIDSTSAEKLGEL